ncbi:Ltp family lipoprotein [Bacillus sp. HNG]|uniref:Ltp family lipoprotein n=1 Tax=Bacillus sp. HNG TaxID=2293325 RepID=UPI001CB94738|nr:Ltp family lipoprotein [Bacillus sp. HNG]
MFIGLISFVGMIVFLILGIVGAFRKSKKTKRNFIITGVCFVLLIAALSFSGEPSETDQAESPITETEKDEVEQEEPTEEEVVPEVEEKEEPVKEEPEQPKEEVKEEPQLTVSQQNAIRHAENYISTMPFSKTGLIEQLEYEGYSTEDATFAVDHIEVDWREQAVRHAKNYNDTMPMSRQGLIDQLMYEGHSQEDSTYAVEQIGL